MAKKRAVSTVERCPNCNAFLPAAPAEATHRRCEYCGVELELPKAPPSPPPRAEPPPPRHEAPKSSGGGFGWWVFLIPLVLSGTIYWSTQRRSHPGKTPDVFSLLHPTAGPGEARNGKSASTQIPSPDADPLNPSESQTPGKKPRRHGHDSSDSRRFDLCHVSGMQMSAVVDANQARAKKCFDAELARFPADVGLTSNWEIELDGSGHVYAAHGRLHLLDFKRAAELREQKPVALPGTSATSCMAEVVKGWSFPAYSPKDGGRLRMKCSFNFVIRDL